MWAIHPVRVGFMKFGWNQASFWFYFAAILASTLVAGASFHFIERPILKLKARFSSDRGASKAESRQLHNLVDSIAR
jgi:peptidoglycan/LPS O-acetylase OafA/YrhL